MEKVCRIAVIIFLCIVLAIYQYWSIALILAIVCLFINAFKRTAFCVFFLPIVCSLIAYVVHDYVLLAVWLFLLYASRMYIQDKTLQRFEFILFFIFFIIATKIFLPQITIVGVLLLIFTIPIRKHTQYGLSKSKTILSGVAISLVWFVIALYAYKTNTNERRCAYMNHGVWCKPTPAYTLENLSNSSAYSYSELCKMLEADTISNLQSLDKYNELWIMTPTKPFTKEEFACTRNWVRKGGHLIVGTDHTDLYGHARVANSLLHGFGCKVSYTSVFETNKSSYFANCMGHLCPLKTPNSIDKMTLGFPLLSIAAWKERAYYANDNFFGPMSANANNVFDIQDIASTRHYGIGSVTVVADTTFCANFAIYQPYVREFIAFLTSYHAEALIILILSLIYVIHLLFKDHKHIMLISACLCLFPIITSVVSARKLTKGINVQIWTGNRTFLEENVCPFSCISTAYSLSPLSGKTPCWEDDVDENVEDVIWVDSIPPRNSRWRWIHITDNHNHFYTDGKYDNDFDILYKSLGALEVRSYSPAFIDFNKVSPECVFNDAVMNDWWYGNFGLSTTRMQRISAWIQWLQKDERHPAYTDFNRKHFTKELYPAIIHIKDSNPIKIVLPKPILSGGEEINFGCGIIGKIISQENDTIKIVGLHEFSEGWDCPQIWTLMYTP